MDEKKKKQHQDKLILKMLGSIRDHQFIQMNMEEIAKTMGISRATLYKYFENKEEIFSNFIEGLIVYFEQHALGEITEETLEQSFQKVFEQSISLALLMPESFMLQLEAMYPELHEQFKAAISKRNKQVIAFYQYGMDKGLFNHVNPTLLVAQQQLYETTLFNPKFLMQNQLTVEKALWDFYSLQKQQLFKKAEDSKLNEGMQETIQYLANKVTNLIF